VVAESPHFDPAVVARKVAEQLEPADVKGSRASLEAMTDAVGQRWRGQLRRQL
jgi:hypothetical protein